MLSFTPQNVLTVAEFEQLLDQDQLETARTRALFLPRVLRQCQQQLQGDWSVCVCNVYVSVIPVCVWNAPTLVYCAMRLSYHTCCCVMPLPSPNSFAPPGSDLLQQA